VKVRAAVLTGVDAAFEVTEVDLAPPRTGEVLVKVAASGLCRSDLNAITGKRTLVPFPAVLGHEAAGVVAECGPGAQARRRRCETGGREQRLLSAPRHRGRPAP
jgi:S-(hydroxymethyl)glutathione dehydrogenase / alcohol dehydrogenase